MKNKIAFSFFLFLFLFYSAFFAFNFSRAQFAEETPGQEAVTEASRESWQNINLILSVINFVLGLIFLVSIFGFLVAGFKALVAGGDEAILQSAQTTAYGSAAGLAFSAVGYIITSVIKHFLL